MTHNIKTVDDIVSESKYTDCIDWIHIHKDEVRKMIISASIQAFNLGTDFGYANGTSGTCYEVDSEFNSCNSYIKAITNNKSDMYEQ